MYCGHVAGFVCMHAGYIWCIFVNNKFPNLVCGLRYEVKPDLLAMTYLHCKPDLSASTLHKKYRYTLHGLNKLQSGLIVAKVYILAFVKVAHDTSIQLRSYAIIQ